MYITVSLEPISSINWDKLSVEFKDYKFIYQYPNIVEFYPYHGALIAKMGNTEIGIWLIPLYKSDSGNLHAERSIRLLPYSAPILKYKDVERRRSIMIALGQYLQTFCQSISLPLAPDFHDLNGFGSLGIFVEWRHTYRFYKCSYSENNYSSTVRNAIKHSKINSEVFNSQNIQDFNFEKGIVTNIEEHRIQRKRLIDYLLNKNQANIIKVQVNSTNVGGAVIVLDKQTAYLFHSWFDRNILRGIPSLVIHEAVNWSFNQENISVFDFEGSLLATVDKFMSGFGAEITPYGYLHWHQKSSQMSKMLMDSVEIPGRIDKSLTEKQSYAE